MFTYFVNESVSNDGGIKIMYTKEETNEKRQAP